MMQDKTPYYMIAMVIIVAFAAVTMAIVRLGSNAPSSDSLTGNVVTDTQQPTSANVNTIADIPTPSPSIPDSATRMLTILSVAFCITLALYLYFHEEY